MGDREHRQARVDLGEAIAGADHEPGWVSGLEDPPAVVGYADRHHVVPLPVDGLQHAARSDARDRVLAGAATEQHRHPGAPTVVPAVVVAGIARGGWQVAHRAPTL